MTDDSQEFARALLHADNEESATSVVEAIESEHSVKWVTHRDEKNYRDIFGQHGDAVPAFNELVVNSIDAVLRKRYIDKHGLPVDPDIAPQSSEEAAEELFGSGIDETIEVLADGGGGPGDDGKPNLIVRDTGAGQPPDMFEEAFLSMAGDLKAKWPFLQGRYAIGSQAVLMFSGGLDEFSDGASIGKHYKFVCSASHERPGEWGWSITRLRPGEEHFEYLTVDGSIPTFDGTMAAPGGAPEQVSGTFVKVYEYDMVPASNITADFRDHLDRAYPNPALPISITETRDFDSAVMSITTEGLLPRLKNGELAKYVKWNRVFANNFGPQFGSRRVRVVVFKDEQAVEEEELNLRKYKDYTGSRSGSMRAHDREAVFYMVNGQTHGSERGAFLHGGRPTDCKFGSAGYNTLVFIDLSDFGHKAGEHPVMFHHLFKTSRSGLQKTDLAKALRLGLRDALKGYEPLKDEDDYLRRRRREVKTDEEATELWQDLYNRNKMVKNVLRYGETISAPAAAEPTVEPDKGQYLPSFLRIVEGFRDGEPVIWDGGEAEVYSKDAPVNQNPVVHFETDARDDFFDRKEDRGRLGFDPVWAYDKARLSGGILSIELAQADMDPGDVVEATVQVSPTQSGELKESFQIQYVEPRDSGGGGGPRKKRDRGEDKTHDPPQLIPVYEDSDEGPDWEELGWDEDDVMLPEESGGEALAYVNMDAGVVRYYIDNRSLAEADKEFVQNRWLWAVGTMGLAAYSRYQVLLEEAELTGSSPPSIGQPAEIVSHVMQGAGQLVLDWVIDEDDLA